MKARPGCRKRPRGADNPGPFGFGLRIFMGVRGVKGVQVNETCATDLQAHVRVVSHEIDELREPASLCGLEAFKIENDGFGRACRITCV